MLKYLKIIFFLSGFSALIYQITWQRVLFLIYGVNIEAITVIVTVFMLGLGIGSLAGGQISKLPLNELLLFAFAEFLIGILGLISLDVMHKIGEETLNMSLSGIFLVTFLILLIPTILMGATLPILVNFCVRMIGSVGQTVSNLYSVNTLGSAIACIAVSLFFMGAIGLQNTVYLASFVNILASITTLLIYRKHDKKSYTNISLSEKIEPEKKAFNIEYANKTHFKIGVFLGFITGFISLSFEILWSRVFYLAYSGAAYAFPIMLGFYLLGIALGAGYVQKICDSFSKEKLIKTLSLTIFFSGLSAFMLIPAEGIFSHIGVPELGLYLVTIIAMFFGIALPIIAHVYIPRNDSVGAKTSYIYFANIMGSTIGSLLTGFILLEHFKISEVSSIMVVICFITSATILINIYSKYKAISICVLFSISIYFISPLVFYNFYDLLINQISSGKAPKPFINTFENRSGVINVTEDKVLFGSGVYDGTFNIDPINDTNMIIRPYSLSFLHPNPKKVLMIGLSTGSWAQVIANNPLVEELTVIEINKGYLGLIEQYDEVKSLLKNPKVNIIIDDGRRWLRRNPNEKFDIIVMNTTYHWRAYASNLLSLEFLGLIKQHIEKSGVLLYNATFSKRVYKTACRAFPYGVRVINHMAVSNKPMSLDVERWQNIMKSYSIDSKKVLNLKDQEHIKYLAKFSSLLMSYSKEGDDNYSDNFTETCDSIIKRTIDYKVITDDNMGTEWQWWAIDY